MNTKRMITNAILIAIGAILHQITPLLGLPMQPDLSLAMLFIIMIYNKDYKATVICGLIVGIFTALTTKTPGGQLPNIMEKVITCNIMYLVLIPLRNRLNKTKQMATLLATGTVLSGTIFLTLLMMLAGLPVGASFGTLFLAIVIPTAILNVIVGLVLFKVVERAIATTGAYATQR